MSMKATAMPSPGLIFFTMARARTSPPGTSKSNFTSVPTGAGSGVEINNPPSPSVTTRDIPRPSTHCHATNMPFGRATRTYLRFTSLAVGLMTTLFDYGGRTPVRTTFTLGTRPANYLYYWPSRRATWRIRLHRYGLLASRRSHARFQIPLLGIDSTL